LNLRPGELPADRPAPAPAFAPAPDLATAGLPADADLPAGGWVAAAGTCIGDLHLGHLTAFPAKSSRTAKVDWHFPQPTLIVIRLFFFLRMRYRNQDRSGTLNDHQPTDNTNSPWEL
ncbi:MAG: hypothetical protein ACK557_18970, partial [Planctomycetota bacterium]